LIIEVLLEHRMTLMGLRSAAEFAEHYSATARNGYYAITAAELIAPRFPISPPYMGFDKPCRWLAMCMHLEWWTQAEELFDTLAVWLTTRSLKGGNSRDQDAWFILLCAALAFETNLGDFEPKLIEPTYIEALRLPGDANPKAFDACVTALCDFHLNQWNDDPSDDASPALFTRDEEHLHAVEILAWFATRRRLGFVAPDECSHPLARLPINQRLHGRCEFVAEPLAQEVLSRIVIELEGMQP
jgi:hypothetical protein